MDSPARRHVREAVPLRLYRLGEEPADELLASTSAAERVQMVAELSRRAWEFGGCPAPTYTRARTPVTVIRRP